MKPLVSPNSFLYGILQFLIISMWTYAAVSKLIIYESYRFELLSHELLRPYAHVIAWLLPAVELFIVSFILMEKTRRVGFVLSAGLLVIFTAYIIYMFQFYPHTPCSCGGILSAMDWKEHIAFNIFFIALSILPLIKTRERTVLASS